MVEKKKRTVQIEVEAEHLASLADFCGLGTGASARSIVIECLQRCADAGEVSRLPSETRIQKMLDMFGQTFQAMTDIQSVVRDDDLNARSDLMSRIGAIEARHSRFNDDVQELCQQMSTANESLALQIQSLASATSILIEKMGIDAPPQTSANASAT